MTRPERGTAVKCVVWDLDETLWHGTLLERLEGEPVSLRAAVPTILRALDERGVLHSIASRNAASDALAQLRRLGVEEYFVHPQVGWEPKSAAVARIAERLGLAVSAILFIDDQQVEIDEVRDAHPAIQWLAASAIDQLLSDPRLQPAVVTPDSRARRQRIRDDMRRGEDEAAFVGPRSTFLAGLDMRMRIYRACEARACEARAGEADLARAEELTLRTSQLNTTGITFGRDELARLSRSPDHELLLADLEDRYGPYGCIGLALVEKGAPAWRLPLLLMSCRVLSRGVGQVLLSCVMRRARRAGRTLEVELQPTERNRMMQVTLAFAGFRELPSPAGARQRLAHDLLEIPAYPAHVQVVEPDEDPAAEGLP